MLKRHISYLTLFTVMVSVVSKQSVEKIRSAFKAVRGSAATFHN